MDCKFNIGQQVICIDAKCVYCGDPIGLIEKNIYTVVAIFSGVATPLVLVEEAQNHCWADQPDGAYLHTHFRAVKETSIEQFRGLLSPTDKKVLEPV